MKGSAIFILIGLLLLAVTIILVVGSMGDGQVVVIANNTNYFANQSFNYTYMVNTTINNTYYIGSGSVTIPAENVTTGTFYGEAYAFNYSMVDFYPYDIGAGWSTAQIYYGVLTLHDNTPFHNVIFTHDPTGAFISITDLRATKLNTTGFYANGNTVNILVNTTQIGNNCETHKGTQVNYSRCFNSTGQVIETIGVFPV